VIFFVTSTMSDADVPWWARWFLMFAPLFIVPLVFASIGLADMKRDDGKRRGGLALIYGLPIVFWLVMVLGFLIITMLTGGLSELVVTAIWGSGSTASDVVGVAFYVLGMLVLTVLMIVLWILGPKLLRDAKIPELPRPFTADRPHFVRLFDDSTLFHDPALATPTARQLFYPSERRPLLKLWWTGAGDLYARSEQRSIVFNTTGTGPATQRVAAPVVPMTVSDLGAFLQAQVPNLHAVPVFPADSADLTKEPFLPTGATFAEDSDEDDEARGLPASAYTWKKLAKTEADAKYVLHHADKPYQSIRYGQRGPVELGDPQDEYMPGPGKVTASSTTVTGTGGTVFGFIFRPGDQIAVGTQVRIVTLIHSDTELEISAPFSPAVSTASDYVRLGPTDDQAPCPGQVTARKTRVTGTNTRFTHQFTPGDLILIGNQAREVVEVRSDTELEVDEGFSAVGTPTDHFAGGAAAGARPGLQLRLRHRHRARGGRRRGDGLRRGLRGAALPGDGAAPAARHRAPRPQPGRPARGGRGRGDRRLGGEGLPGVPQLEPGPAPPQRVADAGGRRGPHREVRRQRVRRGAGPAAAAGRGLGGGERGGGRRAGGQCPGLGPGAAPVDGAGGGRGRHRRHGGPERAHQPGALAGDGVPAGPQGAHAAGAVSRGTQIERR